MYMCDCRDDSHEAVCLVFVLSLIFLFLFITSGKLCCCSYQAKNPSNEGDEYSVTDTITIDFDMDTNEVTRALRLQALTHA